MSVLDDLLADLTGGDESRAEQASASIAALGETVIPRLQNLIAAPDVDTRWWAVRTLAALPDLDPDLLVPSLVDPAPEVRQCAALGLCSHPRETAVPALARALSDTDSLSAALAAKALIAIGSPAVDVLLEVLRGGVQSARIHAMQVLAEIADPRAIRPMIEAMGEGSAMLNYWAERGLDRLGVNMVYIQP
jgi:HEAT repeat protein